MTIDSLNDATQYATVYLRDTAIATLQRRRVHEDGPAWRLFAPDGKEFATIERTPRQRSADGSVARYSLADYDALANEVRLLVSRHYGI